MALKIEFDLLKEFVEEVSFQNNGDEKEKGAGYLLSHNFPNCEKFWKFFIVPMTQRICRKTDNPYENEIRRRKEVSDDLYEIAVFHYTVFTKLIFAHEHLTNFRSSSFEEFYMQLVSCCDVAEDFLLKVYLLLNECNGKQSKVFQELSKTEFLKLAVEWYDKNYSAIFEHYLNKGKFKSMELPSRENILDEYFDNSPNWKEYKKFTQLLRQYRNVLVHSSVIGKRRDINEQEIMVPKKEKIANYKKLTDVIELASSSKTQMEDFIDMKTQMKNDFVALQDSLNKLWIKPLTDLTTLLFGVKNERLLLKYGIEFKD